jgi:hypothetical protein
MTRLTLGSWWHALASANAQSEGALIRRVVACAVTMAPVLRDQPVIQGGFDVLLASWLTIRHQACVVLWNLLVETRCRWTNCKVSNCSHHVNTSPGGGNGVTWQDLEKCSGVHLVTQGR